MAMRQCYNLIMIASTVYKRTSMDGLDMFQMCGYIPMFSAMYTKGINFHGFMFASLNNEPSPKRKKIPLTFSIRKGMQCFHTFGCSVSGQVIIKTTKLIWMSKSFPFLFECVICLQILSGQL